MAAEFWGTIEANLADVERVRKKGIKKVQFILPLMS